MYICVCAYTCVCVHVYICVYIHLCVYIQCVFIYLFGVDSLSVLQGNFPTQGSNPGLPHCRWILYQLNHNEALRYGWSKHYHQMLEKLAWVETIKKDSLAKLKKKKTWIGKDLLQDVFRNNHTLLTVVCYTCSWWVNRVMAGVPCPAAQEPSAHFGWESEIHV